MAIIEKPLNVFEIADQLGYYEYAPHPVTGQTVRKVDVGRLCTHPNINKWAKYKPVRFNKKTELTDADFKSANYGIGNLSFVPENINAVTKTGVPVATYLEPLGGESSPFRVSDFNKYNHEATYPLLLEMEAVNLTGGSGAPLGTNRLVVTQDYDYMKNRRTGYKVRVTKTGASEFSINELQAEGGTYANARLTLIIGNIVDGKLSNPYRVYQDSVAFGNSTSRELIVDTSKINTEMGISGKVVVIACMMQNLGLGTEFDNISATSNTLRFTDDITSIVAENMATLYDGGIGGDRPITYINVSLAMNRPIFFKSGVNYDLIINGINVTMSANANVRIMARFPFTNSEILVSEFSGSGLVAARTINIPASFVSGTNTRIEFYAVGETHDLDTQISSNTLSFDY